MKGKLSFMWRATLALVLVLSLGVVMAVPVSATHTSSATIAFHAGASTVTGTTGVILDVTVTNNAASDGNITTVKIDFTASDFTVTGVGTEPSGWGGTVATKVVTYTHATGLVPGASVIFVPVVTNPTEAGPAAVPAVLTTDAGSQAALAAALNTGWIAYEADSAGIGGNDITVEYEDPGMVSQALSVSVDVKAITVSLATDGDGVLTSTADDVDDKINTDAAALVDATADSGHLTYVVQPLTVPAFTGGTSPDADKACPLTPATLTITGVVPTITAVAPAAGNVGDTMWVEVTGTDFTSTTTACTTTFDFGAGVSVVADSYHWIDATEIDCQITITASGAVRDVIATTAAGTGTVGSDFMPNAAGTEQVDVWGDYTPVADIAADTWDDATLVMTVAVQTSIGAAITAATTGDVLIAHAATYEEAVVIDESITLESLDGAATTIIDASGASTVGIDITAAGVTLDGFTMALDGMVNGIRIAADGVTVKNSVINDSLLGILVTGGTSTCMISYNHITDSGGQQPAGIVIQGGETGTPTTAITIKENTMDGNISCGIHILRDPNTYLSSILIEGNTITGGDPYGIDTQDGLNITGLVIIKNTITGSWEDGIRINSWDTTSVINYNNLSGNGLYGSTCGGIKNRFDRSQMVVDAKYNWWGADGGPSAGPSTYTYASTALGTGDIVSKDVTYDPWLTETQAKTVSDGIAYFGSTMTLEPGWNTLSVPLKLKDSANTLTEIATLGDFLTATNWEIAYQYNPAIPGWENIGTSAIELVPGRGYYIKILGTDDVNLPVLYSGTLGLPAYDLTTGWNLIGSAFGIDKEGGGGDHDYGVATIGIADGEKVVNVALDSIVDNASVVVSPTVPGQVAAWALLATESSTEMQVGEAYWVFMGATDTLAGFEVTPIYKLFLP